MLARRVVKLSDENGRKDGRAVAWSEAVRAREGWAAAPCSEAGEAVSLYSQPADVQRAL